MKRNTVIAVVLCLMMITTTGAGTASAKQDENPRQAGKSSIYFYDVESKSVGDSNGYGKLKIDTAKKTFVFNGWDFTPMQNVQIKADTASGVEIIARGKSTKSGNLHIQGSWEGTVVPGQGTVGAWYYYEPAYGFNVNSLGGYVARLKVRYSLDDGATWITTTKETGDVDLFQTVMITIDQFEDDDHIIPDCALVKMKVVVIGGDDVWTDETFYRVHGNPPGYCWPDYELHGPTWNASTEYWGDYCQPYLDSDYWWEWSDIDYDTCSN